MTKSITTGITTGITETTTELTAENSVESQVKNNVEITAIVVERAAMRYTPAGIEVLSVTLQHTSQQSIGTGLGLAPRTIELQLKAQFFGADARRAEAMKLNEAYLFKGYLAPMRVSSKALWLMVSSFG